MLRIEGIATESVHSVPVKKLAEILVIPDFDLLNLMRSAETIEEMKERNSSLDR